MGRENTISIGSIRRNTSVSSGGGGSNGNGAGLFNNFSIGRVTFLFADNSIEYELLNNSYGVNKKGYAFPYDQNLTQIPTVGNSVLLVSSPKDYGNLAGGQFGSRGTFYTAVMNSTANVGGTIVDPASSGWTPSKNINSQQKKDGMIFTKEYLKNKGINKAAAAALMGNIMVECTFDHTASTTDVNGKTSVGIIQWNGTPGGGSGYDISQIPQNDLKGQLDKLFDTSFTKPMAVFLKEVNDNPTGNNNAGFTPAGWFAYYFAWKIEVCSACNEGPAIYRQGKQIKYPNGNVAFVEPNKRSLYADDFYKRFEDPGDSLAWSGTSVSNTKTA